MSSSIFSANIVVKGVNNPQGNKLLMTIETIFEKEDFKLVSISAIKNQGRILDNFKVQVKTDRDYQIMEFIALFDSKFTFNEVSVK